MTQFFFREDSSKTIAISIDGEVISDLEIYSYTLRNTGNSPIRPDDYVEPITVSVEENQRIITVEKDRSNPESMTVSWKQVDENKFQLNPLLLNPNDSVGILLFVSELPKDLEDAHTKGERGSAQVEDNTSNDGNKSKETSDDQGISENGTLEEPIWAARIVNIRDLNVTDYEEIRELERESLGIFFTRFAHSGWSVYRFGFITFILFLFGLFLGIQFGPLQKVSPQYYISLSVLMILSVVSGDNIASRINGLPQPLISNLSLLLYFSLMIIFAFPTTKNIFKKGS